MNNTYIFKKKNQNQSKKDINKKENNINQNNNDINENEKEESKIRIKRQCINKEILLDLIDMIKKNETNENKKFNMILLNILLYLTGCRISEILVLNKLNIQTLINNGKYIAFCSKTKTKRTLYINQGGKQFILNNLGVNEEDFNKKLNEKGLSNMYNNKLDKRTSYNWMNKYFLILTEKYYNNENNYNNDDKNNNKNDDDDEENNELAFNYHSYRTNFINQMCRINDNFDEVSRLVGHKNPYTTFIYWRELHIDENKINDNISKALL